MMRRFLHDRRGLSYVRTVATVLALSMLLAVILSFASWMTIVQTSRADTQRVLDSFCIDKAQEIYSSIKQGNNRMLRGEYTDVFMLKLVNELGLEKNGNLVYHKGDSGEIIYHYTQPLTANLKDDTLTLTMDYELVLPVTFAGRRLADLRVPLQVTAAYVLKN